MADIRGIPMLPRPVRTLMGPLGISAAGMERQQKFMEIIATNILNANTTRGADGQPYHRQIAVAGIDPRTGEATTTVHQDKSEGEMVFNPDHVDADPNGYVHYPNVNVATEEVDMMIARRMHDANATVFQSAKAMLRKALEI